MDSPFIHNAKGEVNLNFQSQIFQKVVDTQLTSKELFYLSLLVCKAFNKKAISPFSGVASPAI